MKILCKVNQKEALKTGIDAPKSTVELEINPSTIDAAQRELLAGELSEGYRLRHNEIPELVCPDTKGLLDALRVVMARRAKDVENAKNYADNRIRDIRAWLASPRTLQTSDVYVQGDGFPVYGRASWLGRACPSIYGLPDDLRADVEAERAVDAVAQKDAEMAERQRIIAEQEAKMAPIRTEYAQMFARLPETLRLKSEAGYSTDEVKRELKKLCRMDAGLPTTYRGWDEAEDVDDLTDEQFMRLRAMPRPEGATVNVKRVWDVPTESADNVDETGAPERVNERVVARIVWKRAGMEIVAVVEL